MKAVALSFFVYLLPLVGPHSSFPFGMVLYIELAAGVRGRPADWITSDVTLALLLQSLAALTTYWYLLAPRWQRALGLLGTSVVLFFLLQWGYLSAIPALFQRGQGSLDSGIQSVFLMGQEDGSLPIGGPQ